MTPAATFQTSTTLRVRTLDETRPVAAQQGLADILAIEGLGNEDYIVGFAQSRAAIVQTLRLRYEVFNLEMGEGLAQSHRTGLDEDEFDAQMTHIVLVERAAGRVVGTYRVQTARHGLANRGIYSDQEFDLADFEPWLDLAIELGRVCIAPEHRATSSLHLLWAGVAAFMRLNGQRYLFGCCSIPATDPNDGWRALRALRRKGYLHGKLLLPAREACSCGAAERETDPALEGELKLPTLFAVYARQGAKIISQPAIDRAFGTIDFLILMDGVTARLPGVTAGAAA